MIEEENEKLNRIYSEFEEMYTNNEISDLLHSDLDKDKFKFTLKIRDFFLQKKQQEYIKQDKFIR